MRKRSITPTARIDWTSSGGTRHGPATITVSADGDITVIKVKYDRGQLTGRWSASGANMVLHGYIGAIIPPAFVFAVSNIGHGRVPRRSASAYFLTDGRRHLVTICDRCEAPPHTLLTHNALPITDETDQDLAETICEMVNPTMSRLLHASFLQMILDDIGLADWFVAAGCTERIDDPAHDLD